MKWLAQVWREEDGVLSFEWTLLLTLLTIGIVSGLAAARDAIIDELGDIAQAAQGIDQSFSLTGTSLSLDFNNDNIPDFTATSAPSSFQEQAKDHFFSDCGRTSFAGQDGSSDGSS
jgi:Flp pilus assembly pilin Flp